MTVRQRQPRVECPAFLEFVRGHACCVCGAPPKSQAAHIRFSDAMNGSLNPGIGAKPDDSKCLPLCAGCHLDNNNSLHRCGERAFWDRVGIDPFALAATLYDQFEKQQRRREPKERAPRPRRPVAKRATPKHKRKWPKGTIAGRPFGPGRKFGQHRLVERSK